MIMLVAAELFLRDPSKLSLKAPRGGGNHLTSNRRRRMGMGVLIRGSWGLNRVHKEPIIPFFIVIVGFKVAF